MVFAEDGIVWPGTGADHANQRREERPTQASARGGHDPLGPDFEMSLAYAGAGTRHLPGARPFASQIIYSARTPADWCCASAWIGHRPRCAHNWSRNLEPVHSMPGYM